MSPAVQPLPVSPSLRRLAVFAHFDREDRLRPYITHYLQALRPFLTSLWFVSTSKLSDAEQAPLANLCDRIQLKANVGQDFGMWHYAFQGIDWQCWDEVLLVNSSTYAPLHPLAPLFRRLDELPGDFLGITESLELDPHLQSYFLLFRRQVIRHECWAQFWSHLLPYVDKRQTIRSYELGLTQWLKQHGFQATALFPATALGQSSRFLRIRGLLASKSRLRNPSLSMADVLLDAGCPFLKVEVLRDNPGRVSAAGLRSRIKSLGFPEDLITSNPPNLFTVR
jgi:lipopolysaccharide biosynthesis protein